MERERIGRNGAVQAKRSLLSPDFYPAEGFIREIRGAVAMGSIIRPRSGASFTSLVQSYLAI
ncbi:hypothetical protein MMB75_23545 [Paenibacillus sp. P2(2022)]|uniref:hypothetical protein n=1 Tax=Paenibacillus TaxID=44249 RepID=UPI000AD11120|nr:MULTISPECIES: hypothetical protein [Paenibacillus]MBY7737530.1 hypothetical protein [Paenibacillus polymyxa]MDG0056610.1 hypothetical protein [Paenibacillus sp. P2(2022)]MDN4085307.1 hypothetical protein [Paenibacillus polymyxa]MDN4111531.1 hypothetical protein [Paenibacillus polymyxa]WOZ38906.1 hypothetical protein RQP19_02140 [Paenibacillus polymyxa]